MSASARRRNSDYPTPSDQNIQQAKTPVSRLHFLPIVAEPSPLARTNKPEPKLTRVAFTVSRLMEFCSQRELQSQTGHSVHDWPLVVVKELLDNSLDACEEAEVAPDITVIVEPDRIIVRDNASGIDTKTIGSILDYSIRVSSREAYVSPTRGAQGNALKTILAMGYVLDGAAATAPNGPLGAAVGVTVIETRGEAHRIEFRSDHINNEPTITHTTSPSPVNVGTRFTVYWPKPELLLQEADRFQQLVRAYVWFNPHLTVRGVWLDREFINVTATNPGWKKWRPRNPTSPHWYDCPRLQRYLAAHVARDRDLRQSRTVREFVSEFRGLSGTVLQRKILNEVGCSHQSLASFFGVDQVNRSGIVRLLAAMQTYSKPVAPKHLGIIGAAHFKARFLAAGGAVDTFKYRCRKGIADGIPYVVEFGFGLHQTGLEGGRVAREIVTGANWSAAITNPFRRFGATAEGLESILAKVRANAHQPVICALHLASARIQFADRGKSSIILDTDAELSDD
jgi:DNA topoisomerase VI subunit B